MRLNTIIEAECNFARWQLEVGQGMHTDEGGNITLPDSFKCEENTVGSLISTIYPSISNPNLPNPEKYFSECTILSTLNTKVDCLNAEVLSKFSGEAQVFHSADSIPTSKQSGQEDIMLNYPVEYLNSINCSGLPLSKLKLKEGCPIIVLRNLDAAHGVCNGSRGIVTRLRSRVVEVKLLSEDFAGQKVFIPRISNQPTEDQVAFKFNRR
jgi:PIF1-like helicase